MRLFNTLSIITICLCWASAERDFHFNDDIQLTLTEPPEEGSRTPIYRHPYSKEISQCSNVENKIILSLVLKSNDWTDLIEKKRSRALNKLSKFFGIPKEYIHLESVTRRDIYDMNKRSIKRGPNKCESSKRLGKIEFMIGCGQALFVSGEPISNQIGHQMKDGSIDDISGVDFGWWVIWRKKISNRVQRNRRAADENQEGAEDIEEGSGDDYDYDYDGGDDDKTSITEIPTTTTHAHRHHHGILNKPEFTESNIKDLATNTLEPNAPKIQDGAQSPQSPIDEDIVQSVSKLESDITKTIENTKKIKDLPTLITELARDTTETSSSPTMVFSLDLDEIIPETTTWLPDMTTTLTNFNAYGGDGDGDSGSKDATTTTPVVGESATTPSVATKSVTLLDTTTQFSTIPTTLLTKQNHDDITTTFEPFISDELLNNPINHLLTQNQSIIVTVTSPTAAGVGGGGYTTPTANTPTTTMRVIVDTTTEPSTTTATTFTTTTLLSTTTTTTANFDSILTAKNDSKALDEDDTTTVVVKPEVETTTLPTTTTSTTTTTTTTTTPKTTTTTTTEYIEPEPVNTPPMIKTRLPKQPVTAGKPFSLTVPQETFFDNEDGTNLRLQLFDKNGNELKPSSWIQFNPETREIYGLPLEDAVSRWQYKLAATDSGNETVTETVDISVQQHKGHRSVNHEISLAVKLNEKFIRNIDWQIRLIRGIVETVNDNSLSNVVVREVRQNQQDPHLATFVYTNESLPKDSCPEEKLEELVKRLDAKKLTESLLPEMSVKTVTAQLIGPCQKINPPKPKPTPHMTKNYPPVPRNQVDRVNATVGHLLVYKVPQDTFYDPEDTTDLKLSLLDIERNELSSTHWLQFDSKNQEFYGIPKSIDSGREEYLLVAEDHGGLTATDALLVVVNHSPKREFSVSFRVYLGIRHELFTPHMQRKFVERMAMLFGDPTTQLVQIKSIAKNHDTDGTVVNFYNTTLYKMHNHCPDDEIEAVRNVFFHQDAIVRDRVKKVIGNEFDFINVQITQLASCHSFGMDTIHREVVPIKTEDKNSSSSFKDEYLLTFIVPAVIIVSMILLAAIVACVLHRRRLTGKMELGNDEERKSFRSKGIPVIFQDELDEKLELGNKSPVILKDEKPPLLPPSYNSANLDGDNDVDEYVPPPAVVIGGREVRGKSPVTPSYRKPPPYVSP